MSTRALFATVLLALALTAVSPPFAHGADKALSTDLAWGIPQSAFAPTGQAISDLGAGWVRVEFRWNEAEPSSKGSYDQSIIARYDQAIDTARAAGVKVLVFVNGAPQMGVRLADPDDEAAEPGRLRRLRALRRDPLRRQSVCLGGLEPGEHARFSSSGPSPSSYVPLLKAAYPSVKGADPNALVVFGGVSQNDYAFIEGAYAAGAKGYFDVMAVHPYPGPNPPETVWFSGGRIASNAFTGFQEVRASMLARGDDKPIWLTEFGWSTTTTEAWGVTQAQQADYLTRAYRLLESHPYVQLAYWYNLRNNFWDDDADTWETQLGLMRTDFWHKPSYDAFKSYRPGRPAAMPPSAMGPSASPTSQSQPRHTTPPSAAHSRRATRTFIMQRHRRLVVGRVVGADGGRLTIRVQRREEHGRWGGPDTRGITLGPRGAFRLKLRFGRAWMLRIRALYRGSATAAPSSSAVLRVTH